ncbi:MAG: hypothetical protein ACXVSF_14915 [Solirubrobacteraceae bacterium]
MRPVAGFADQDDPGVADQRHQRVVVAMVAGQRMCFAVDRIAHRALAER